MSGPATIKQIGRAVGQGGAPATQGHADKDDPGSPDKKSAAPNKPNSLVQSGAPRSVRHSDYREFLPAALEIVETPASPKRVALIWLVCGMLAAALLWSYVAKLDIYAVATGRIQTIGRSKAVQSVTSGRIVSIKVSNGSKVKAGELLLALDPADAKAALQSVTAQVEALDAEIARRRAEIRVVSSGLSATRKIGSKGVDIEFPSNVGAESRLRERNLFNAELDQYFSSMTLLNAQLQQNMATKDRLTSSVKAEEQLIAVLQERLDMKRELRDKGAGTKTDVLTARQQVDQALTQLANDKGQVLETNAAAELTKQKMEQQKNQFLAEQANKLTDAENKRIQAAQDLVRAADKLDETQLKAPISGTVQQLAVTTIGQVVQAGQPLLVIVPTNEQLEVEALVQNQDIGFIKVGQHAVVKIDSFPFSRYGTIKGDVVRMSRDSVFLSDAWSGDAASAPQKQNASVLDPTQRTQNLVYPVTVALDRSTMWVDGRKVHLVAGMTTQVEIRTGARRVIDYLLSPLREMASQAGHER